MSVRPSHVLLLSAVAAFFAGKFMSLSVHTDTFDGRDGHFLLFLFVCLVLASVVSINWCFC